MDCTDIRARNDNDTAMAAGDLVAVKDDVARPAPPATRQPRLHDVRSGSKIGWPDAAVLVGTFVLSLVVLLSVAYESGQHQASSTLASSPRPVPTMAWVALDDQPAQASDLSVCRCPCQDSAGQAAKGRIVGSRLRAHCVCQCALATETVGPLLNPDRLALTCACVLGIFFPIAIIAMDKCGLFRM
ncbi:hypothetical protein [Pandoravirus japonicus]|uniref:Uncharacterized protein n=1 Tax=Pandoravirus japonicus TaxID=2823154 RepID=A0A811BMJ0_9VIRU|nr:hypothetical protein [Pandoravirus japonicus]